MVCFDSKLYFLFGNIVTINFLKTHVLFHVNYIQSIQAADAIYSATLLLLKQVYRMHDSLHDGASGKDIRPFIKIDKPLVI